MVRNGRKERGTAEDAQHYIFAFEENAVLWHATSVFLFFFSPMNMVILINDTLIDKETRFINNANFWLLVYYFFAVYRQ